MKRRILQETNWGVFLVLALALFSIVNYLGFRHYHRWDLTASKTFSLSPQTEKVLKGLKKPLDVVVFLAPGDELYGKVKDLLNAYQSASPEVHVETIDPDRQRARMQELAKQYNVATANTVVFALGGASKYVEKDQMVDYDFSSFGQGGTPKIKSFKAEEAFTNAILDLLEPKKPVIYFTTGHGEREAGGQGDGIGIFKDRLSKEGAQVKEWPSLGQPAVPADADLVVVAGPEHPFLPQEAAALDAYLKAGGKALFLLDPVLIQGKPPSFGTTGLEGMLKGWGVGVDQDLDVDPKGAVPYLGAQTFFAAAYSQHPIVRDLAKNKLPVLFTLACSLEPQGASDPDYKADKLVQSTAEAWGEKDLSNLEKVAKDPTDVQGPLTLAAAVSSDKEGKKARLVVVGDSDLISDSLLQAGGGNLLFGLNAVHWLLSQENRLSIPPKTEVETHLALTAAQSNFLFVLFVVALPGLVVAAGVFAYMKRRR